MPAWCSKAIEYWKPERPPPTRPMGNPAGGGSWVAIISRTLAIAGGVRISGAFFSVSGVVVAGAVVVVAMISPSSLVVFPRCYCTAPQGAIQGPFVHSYHWMLLDTQKSRRGRHSLPSA